MKTTIEKWMMVCIAVMLSAQIAQSQTCCLKITLDRNKMLNPTCNLAGAAKVYMHSGLCTSDPTTCNDVRPSESLIWQHIVGNWGLNPQDDGIGLMTDLGGGIYSITIDVDAYFSDPNIANYDEGQGPMAPGTPFYSMGVVFRNEDGSISGRDNYCFDIFILGLNTATPFAVQSDNSVFDALTVEWVNSVGIDRLYAEPAIELSPNPFDNRITVTWVLDRAEETHIEIFDTGGRLVRTFHPGLQYPGAHQWVWDGRDGKGNALPAGVYFCKIHSARLNYTGPVVKIN